MLDAEDAAGHQHLALPQAQLLVYTAETDNEQMVSTRY